MTRMNQVAALHERYDIICKPKTVGVSALMPPFATANRVRGNEISKWNRDVLPRMEPLLEKQQYMAYYLFSVANEGICLVTNEGEHGAQLVYFGGAPVLAHNGLPAKPAAGQQGFRIEDNRLKLRVWMDRFFEVRDVLRVALTVEGSKCTPSFHNSYHVAYDHFLKGWGGNYYGDRRIEDRNTKYRLYGHLGASRAILAGMARYDDSFWAALPQHQISSAQDQLAKHQVESRRVVLWDCLFDKLWSTCKPGGVTDHHFWPIGDLKRGWTCVKHEGEPCPEHLQAMLADPVEYAKKTTLTIEVKKYVAKAEAAREAAKKRKEAAKAKAAADAAKATAERAGQPQPPTTDEDEAAEEDTEDGAEEEEPPQETEEAEEPLEEEAEEEEDVEEGEGPE